MCTACTQIAAHVKDSNKRRRDFTRGMETEKCTSADHQSDDYDYFYHRKTSALIPSGNGSRSSLTTKDENSFTQLYNQLLSLEYSQICLLYLDVRPDITGPVDWA